MKTADDVARVEVFGKRTRSHFLRLNRRAKGNLVFAILFTVVATAWFVWLRPPALGGGATYVMVANKKVPDELLAKLPPAENYEKAVFPTLDQQGKAKGFITKQWDAVVGANVK